MSKHAAIALILLGLAIIVLIITKDRVDVNLIGYLLTSNPASLVYLGWLSLGVLIGALLK